MSPGSGESVGIRMKKEREASLRALVTEGETVIAAGTAEELAQLGPDLGSGTGWTFIVLTDRRVLFARWGSRATKHHEIELSDISAWADGTQYNCYVIVLTHPGMQRRVRGVAHRFLWFAWGTSESSVVRTQTIFRFSRRSTKLAIALRTELEARNLAKERLQFSERSREERTGHSHAILTSTTHPND